MVLAGLFLALMLMPLMCRGGLLGGLFSSSNDKDATAAAAEIAAGNYGVDVSTQIHGRLKRDTFQGKRYFDMLDKCAETYSMRECESTENARVRMNLEQAATQHNYTEVGFKKIKAPPAVWDPIINFYNSNKGKQVNENWPRGNTYVNHWTAPSAMISMEDGNLRGAGQAVKRQIWNAVRPLLEEWTGKKLRETSLYGIRLYTNNSILATHLDRLPLVTSCIINVDQDTEEPWPIEVYDHAGKAHNVTMEPGDMVFYESHTVLHGRPFPLIGNFYANLFVHFIPEDHDQMNAHDHEVVHNSKGRLVGGHEGSNHDGGGNSRVQVQRDTAPTGRQTPLHVAAARGDEVAVKNLLENKHFNINSKDSNGWQPLHEAVHSGNLGIVKLLIAHGADVASRTNGGGTALWWARGTFNENHPVVAYLESINAPFGEPEEEEEKL